jgi:hypothetical protein
MTVSANTAPAAAIVAATMAPVNRFRICGISCVRGEFECMRVLLWPSRGETAGDAPSVWLLLPDASTSCQGDTRL